MDEHAVVGNAMSAEVHYHGFYKGLNGVKIAATMSPPAVLSTGADFFSLVSCKIKMVDLIAVVAGKLALGAIHHRPTHAGLL